jgi:hypothetical protein
MSMAPGAKKSVSTIARYIIEGKSYQADKKFTSVPFDAVKFDGSYVWAPPGTMT